MIIRRVVVVVAALFFLALLAGFAWNGARRALLEFAFDTATGARLHIGSLQQHGGVTVLRSVQLDAAGGRAQFTARMVSITHRGGATRVSFDGANARVTLGHDTLHRLRALVRGLAVFDIRKDAQFQIADGRIAVSRDGSAAAPFTLHYVNAEIVRRTGVPIVSGTALAEDGDAEVPVTFAEGHVRAVALPLQSVFALLPSSDVHVAQGRAHDVDVSWIDGLSGSFAFSDVSGTYAGHAIAHIHGSLMFAPDGLASRRTEGTIDDIPITISADTRDVRSWNDALRSGTPALRGLADAYEMVAPTEHLRSIRLETTAPGMTFAQYAMVLENQPRVVQFVTIDPREKTVHFDTALSGNRLISKGERTSDMGIRTHAVVGLNGDYFDIARTYQPQGLFMMGGRLLRGPTDRQALIIDRSNNVYFDEFRLRGTLQIGERVLPVTQYNNWPLGYVTIITPDFGNELPPASGVRFLSLAYVRGDRYRVTDVTVGRVPAPVRFGVAIGADVKGLALPAVGDEVRLRYALDPPVRNAVAGIGGGPLLLRNGAWYEDPHAPAPDERDVQWPVDALGVLSDHRVIMVAVDGRHPERSAGMTRPQFAKLLQDLGVTDAMALDSGGSVTLVARSPGEQQVSLHNVPSDDSAERYVSNALFVYSSAPPAGLLQNRITAAAQSGTN